VTPEWAKEWTVPLYMTQFAYTADAWALLAQQPINRAEGLSKLCQELGGKLVNVYYSFGEYDGVALLEAPDDTTAAAVVIAAVAARHIKSIKTTRLLTVHEAMEAMRRAGSVVYAPPAQGAEEEEEEEGEQVPPLH
jgi:uncharacterized protein with GYD domain